MLISIRIIQHLTKILKKGINDINTASDSNSTSIMGRSTS